MYSCAKINLWLASIIFGLGLVLPSCTQQAPQSGGGRSQSSRGGYTSSQDNLFEEEGEGEILDEDEEHLDDDSALNLNTPEVDESVRDPKKIHAKITELSLVNPQMHEDEGTEHKAPKLVIDRGNSDYVKIMRCDKSHIMRSATGERISELEDRYDAFEHRKDGWFIAIASYRACKLVAERMSQGEYIDIAAKTGHFYYVLNPCVRKANSLSKRDACSFDFSISEPIEYTNTFLEESLDLAIEVSEITNKLNAAMDEVSLLASLFQARLRACENDVARNNALNGFYRGMISLGVFVGGHILLDRANPLRAIPGVGKLVKKFTGPNMAAMGSNMLVSMAGPALAKAAGVLAVANTCMQDPKAIKKQLEASKEEKGEKKKGLFDRATIAAGSERAKESEADRQIRESQELGDKFRVYAALEQIEAMTKKDPDRGEASQEEGYDELTWKPEGREVEDGTVYRLNLELRRAMKRLRKHDSKIIDVEKLISDFSTDTGLDMADGEALTKAMQP